MNEDELITEGCEVCGVLQKIEKYGSFVCVKCGQAHTYDSDCYRVELSEEQRVLLLSQLKGAEVKVPKLFGTLVCTRTIALDDKPCPEAYEVDFVRVERRRTPATNWYKDGRNHREELGMLVREMDGKRWMVDIPGAQRYRRS